MTYPTRGDLLASDFKISITEVIISDGGAGIYLIAILVKNRYSMAPINVNIIIFSFKISRIGTH